MEEIKNGSIHNYLIIVKAYAPYERKFEYREKAWSWETATFRAVRKFRNETGVKGKKKLDKIWVDITKLT